MPVLEFRSVWKTYDGVAFVLRDVDLAVEAGEAVAVLGDNGSGKTTLLNLAGALDAPTRGSVSVDGRDVAGMSEGDRAAARLRTVGFVFQDHNLVEDVTALENVMLPLRLARAGDAEGRAREALARFGLADLAARKPGELSTGQRQLVAVARAMANGPRLILADEPTAALDAANEALVLEALRKAHGEMGAAIVLAWHGPKPGWPARAVVLRGGALAPA